MKKDIYIEFESFKIIDIYDDPKTNCEEQQDVIQRLEENSEFKVWYSKMIHEKMILRYDIVNIFLIFIIITLSKYDIIKY